MDFIFDCCGRQATYDQRLSEEQYGGSSGHRHKT